MKKIIYSFLLTIISSISAGEHQTIDHVTIAILAKQKAQTLPLYLACIEQQTWPASKTYLYIRTNNNTDATTSILRAWIDKVGDRYAGIYFDDSDVTVPVEKYGQHEWNNERLRVLCKIRQDSVEWAREHESHYFIADCDNFIKPHTLEALMNAHVPIVAPLLHTGNSFYSNYHAAIDENGYFADTPVYYQLLRQEIKGLIELPVVHCTYLVRYEVLDKISYLDGTGRYDYVIFSDSARKQGIPQYLDTREVYGGLTFAENKEQLQEWLCEFCAKEDHTFLVLCMYKNILLQYL